MDAAEEARLMESGLVTDDCDPTQQDHPDA